MLERSQRPAVRFDPLPPRSIGDEQPGAGIGEAVFQLRPGPPGVERNRDRAQRRRREEGHGPFGKVHHGDRHPVAPADAEAAKLAGQSGDRPMLRLVGDPLPFVDGGGAPAMGA
jgi:hypothetical protein